MIAGLTVAMMVRNEEGRVGRALASVADVAERWLVIDTGSADRTREEVRAATRGWPGQLDVLPWRDFGSNRTELVRLAQQVPGTEWVLVLDADHELVDHAHLAGLLATSPADAIQLPYTGIPKQWVSRLLRAGKTWRYIGSTHEYLACAEPYTTMRAEHPRIRDHADGFSRQHKWIRDYRLLKDQLASAPGDARAWFYLGETCRGLQQLTEAIESYRASAGHSSRDSELHYVSRLYAGVLLYSLGYAQDAIEQLRLADAARPQRREALLELAQILNDQGQYADAVDALGPGNHSRPIPAGDLEGIYPPAYNSQMRAQYHRAREGIRLAS